MKDYGIIMKKIFFATLLIALLVFTACSQPNTSDIERETIPLNSDELEILETIGGDIIIVDDDQFADFVTEMIHHTNEYLGYVVQLEGVYSSIDKSVYRILSYDGGETTCSLPLVYLTKDIPDDVWVRVTGIVGHNNDDGTVQTTLEVIAIEVLAKDGNRVLEWEGTVHNH